MKNLYFRRFLLLFALCAFPMLFAQTAAEKEVITSRYDKQKIQELSYRFQQDATSQKQMATQMAVSKGWPVIIEENGVYMELQRVTEDGTPIYYTTFNVDASRSTRTDHLNSGGSLGLNLDGQNMTAHVWDGGIARASHQEYDGPGGNNRFSVGDGSGSLNFHAAHVTGTIMAYGASPNAKGMAPHANAIGSDWNSDLAEATTAAGNGMLVSNHSYGFRSDLVPDYYFGAYITDSRDWDNLMYNAPNYLMVVAAGNDGSTNYNGAPLAGNSAYDKLTGHATSKNNLVVANAQDANIDANGNLISVSISSSSSEGPTDDYRIKPDITGNGSGVYSSYESSDTAYGTISGTSMASPNVSGSLILLQQHANNLNGSYMRAATLKGLVLHTADDAGPSGPDAVYGWGLLNAKRAAETLSTNGNESQISELTLTPGQTYQITVDSDGVNDLIASISWTDPAGTATTATNSSIPRLVNDLDLRVSKGGTTYEPWRLTAVNANGLGDNNVDPFERVEVANASGTYTVTVTHKGSLTNGSQNYTLILTGLSAVPVVCNATTPTGLNVNGFGDTTASISWDAVPGASYDVRYRQTGTTTWTTISVGGNSASLTGLNPLTEYEVQVRSTCPDSSTSAYSSSVTFTTLDVQLNYCASSSNNVNDEYIGRVQLNTIDNPSGAQFYTDFTSISTTLTKDSQYTITVTPTWTGTIYAEGYAVWIDYNRDGDFTDPGELVWSRAATTATPVSGSFTIPSTAVENSTRMRVSMKYNGIPTSCENFTYGEVEDYTVIIEGNGPDTTPPVITLNGASTINLTVGDTYTEQGATATDNVDGDLTASIVIGGDTVNTSVPGTYVVTYNVSDAAGNAATEVTRTVNVAADTTPPVITLNGAAIINLTVGDTYTEQGATATDNVDGDISANIVIGGDTVNTAVAGTYVVTYNVSDAAGNAATQVTRTVNVADVPPPTCDDGIQNGDEEGVDCGGSSCAPCSTGPEIIHQGFFETGWDGWADGGGDCARVSSSRSWEGSYSIRLRDNSGTSSSMTLSNVDISSFDSVEIEFYFYPNSMENGEDFWVRFYNGSSWTTVAAYASGSSFTNGSFYVATVTLDSALYNFATNSGFRFQCDASTNSDQIYIDQVTITGFSGTTTSTNELTSLGGGYTTTSEDSLGFEGDFHLYPNPVKGEYLNVEFTEQLEASFRIVNMLGQTVRSGMIIDNKVNVQGLESGVYFIEVNDGEEIMTKRFIRQ